jgi:hypothetical protein
MIKVRCKVCNKELESHSAQTKSCGCSNMTTVRDDKISAFDLSKVEIIECPNKIKQKDSIFTPSELEYQESRRNRKIKKLEFEIK